MATQIQELTKIGTDLGYKGNELQAFVREQQALARDEREKERILEKEKAEEETRRAELKAKLVELDHERELAIIEKQKLEISERGKKDAAEIELKKIMAQSEIGGVLTESESIHGEEDDTTMLGGWHNRGKPRGPKLSPFDEKDDIDSYIHRFEQYAKLEKWPENTWAIYLAALLKGKALDVYTRLPLEEAKNYKTLKEALLKRYEKTEEGYRKLFYSVRPEVGESQAQFIVRLANYLIKYIEFSGITQSFDGLLELLVKEQYLATCSKELEIFLRERSIKLLDELAKTSEQFLTAHKNKGVYSTHEARYEKRTENREKRRDDKNVRSPKRQVVSMDGKRRCWICESTRHVAKDCDIKAGKRTDKMMAMRTTNNDRYDKQSEDEDGDWEDRQELAAMEMRDLRPVRGNFSRQTAYTENQQKKYNQWKRPTASRSEEKEMKIYCKAHNKEMCKECIRLPGNDDNHACNAMLSDTLELKCGCKLPIVADACRVTVRDNMPVSDGYLNGKAVNVLRDSGCSTVVIRRDLVEDSQLTGAELRCILIDGTIRKVPVAKVTLDTKYFKGETEAVCMRNPLYDVILGNIPGVKDNWNRDELTGEIKMSDSVQIEQREDMEETQAVVTRRMAREENKTRKPLVVVEGLDEAITREKFIEFQKDDESLRVFWDRSHTQEAYKELKVKEAKFIVKADVLYRQYKHTDSIIYTQLLLPSSLRDRVIKMAHDGIMSGHQGITKTRDRVLSQFWYPGITAEVIRFCKSCDICQRTVAKGRVIRVPLGQMPIIETPFERVAVDLIGEIKPKTDRGHRWILTVIDYATRYPEAVALKDISTETVAEALVEIYSRVGIPKEVLSDQGTQFVSNVTKEVSRLLSVRQLVTSPYHPICNGLVEKFNGTLKAMLKKVSSEKPRDWDRYIAPLLFAYRGVKQESLGFSPFELLYGRSVRGPMEILRELWTKENMEGEIKTTYEYVLDLRNRIADTCELARTELAKAQERQRNYYNKRAVNRELKVGGRVLVLRSNDNNKLLMHWQGPYRVTAKENENDYRIDMNGKSRLYHINMLKEYIERVVETNEQSQAEIDENNTFECISAAVIEPEEQDEAELELFEIGQTESFRDVDVNPELNENERLQVLGLIEEFQDIFTDRPRITNLGLHEINLTADEPIRSKPYPLPHAMRAQLSNEIHSMISMDIIEKSTAAYASPVVMVKKSDNSVRVCCDYRKLNKITVFDPEPMITADDIFVKLNGNRYFFQSLIYPRAIGRLK